MVINDRLLREWAANGGVENFDPTTINPASIDLRWSGNVRVAKASDLVMDLCAMRKSPEVRKRTLEESWSPTIECKDFFIFKPGSFYLLDTMEYLHVPDGWSGVLALKSSIGRMGIEHLHAGYFDPGFVGTATLEIEVRAPWEIALHKGDPIVQIVFSHMIEEPEKNYQITGRYNGQMGPTASR